MDEGSWFKVFCHGFDTRDLQIYIEKTRGISSARTRHLVSLTCTLSLCWSHLQRRATFFGGLRQLSGHRVFNNPDKYRLDVRRCFFSVRIEIPIGRESQGAES